LDALTPPPLSPAKNFPATHNLTKERTQMKQRTQIEETLQADKAQLERAEQLNNDSFPEAECVGEFERGNITGWIEALEWVLNQKTGENRKYLSVFEILEERK
jgi:hypothetical protein